MQVVLENITAEPEAPEPQEAADTESPAAPEQRDEVHKVDHIWVDEEDVVDCSAREPTPPAAPAPKKRGRPPKARAEAPPPAPKVKAPKPKAARKPRAPPVEDSSDSSDVDNTLRNVYNHVAKPDMETAILQFLVNRKQAESTRRRELWGRLAQM
jgi:hypothetical protein